MCSTCMRHKLHMSMFVDLLWVCVLWLFVFCCWWWFVFVCRHFPDDDMARSDSRMKEESKRIQAKCLMEIHVKSFVWSKCFSFFAHGCQWIGHPWLKVHVNIVGIVLLTFLDVSKNGCKLVLVVFHYAIDQLLCWPEFISLVMFEDWWILPQKGARSIFGNMSWA